MSDSPQHLALIALLAKRVTNLRKKVNALATQRAAAIEITAQAGRPGPMPKHQWQGTRLRFEQAVGRWGKWMDLKGPPGGVAVIGAGDGLDLRRLPAATDTVPDGFLTKQGGAWRVATYAQMSEWLGATLTGSGGIVTVNSEVVTVSL